MTTLCDERVACRVCGSTKGFCIKYNKFKAPKFAECSQCESITTSAEVIRKLEMTFLRKATEHMDRPIVRSQGDKYEAAIAVFRATQIEDED